jgi:hypothetical protein
MKGEIYVGEIEWIAHDDDEDMLVVVGEEKARA